MSLAGSGEAIERLVEVRMRRLCAFQDDAYARRYSTLVNSVRALEEQLHMEGGGEEGGGLLLTAAVARNYFKVLAYKDEIEVSRLHLSHGPSAAQVCVCVCVCVFVCVSVKHIVALTHRTTSLPSNIAAALKIVGPWQHRCA